MADPSASSPADEARDPGSPEAARGAPQGANEQEDIRGEATVPTSEPVRGELVQSAVTFLSHPKVVASSDVQRRSFLENKGLTMDEIEEAFRRLLSPPSNSTSSNTCKPQGSPDPETVTPVVPRHPKSYMEVMEMIQRGERPDDIQDINDELPNPDQPISKPRMAPKPKHLYQQKANCQADYTHSHNGWKRARKRRLYKQIILDLQDLHFLTENQTLSSAGQIEV